MNPPQLGVSAEVILKVHNSPTGKYKGFIIEGEPRIGKTVYAIKTMRAVFMALNPTLSEDAAYDMALEHLYFKLGPFLKAVRAKRREIRDALMSSTKIDWKQRIPTMVLDDASLFAGADLHFRDIKMYSAFQNTMTTIGDAVSSLMVTAPSYKALTKCLREFYNYYIVRITKFDEYQRDATIREWYEREGRENMKLRKIRDSSGCAVSGDRFSALLPNRVYAPYLERRIDIGEEATKELETAVEAGVVPAEVAKGMLKELPSYKDMRDELAKLTSSASPRG